MRKYLWSLNLANIFRLPSCSQIGKTAHSVCVASRNLITGEVKSKPTERKKSGDLVGLMRAASAAISQALRDGSESGHGNGDWLTQTQMTAHLADKIGISKQQAESALDELNGLVIGQLKKRGFGFAWAGLGVFRKRKSEARLGRNPATGAQIKIPARTRLPFTAAKALKDSVLGAR
jgi:DNA-binding protein HU-beta